MKFSRFTSIKNYAEDFIALIVAMGVDFVFNYVFFSFVAVDDITRFGFTAIVFLMVFYKVRSLKKAQEAGKKISLQWLMFTIVTCFCGISFTLLDLDYQSRQSSELEKAIESAKIDPELIRIDLDITEKKATEKNNQLQYGLASKRETMDQLFKVWQISIDDRKESELKREKYYSSITVVGKVKITAKDTFSAIPNTIARGEIIQVIIFLLIFVGIEAAIYAAVSDTEKGKARRKRENEIIEQSDNFEEKQLSPMEEIVIKEQEIETVQPSAIVSQAITRKVRGPYMTNRIKGQKEAALVATPDPDPEQEPIKNIVEKWVYFSWYSLRTGRSSQIIGKNTFLEYCRKKQILFNSDIYDKIYDFAVLANVITQDGAIIERDSGIVNEKILKLFEGWQQ